MIRRFILFVLTICLTCANVSARAGETAVKTNTKTAHIPVNEKVWIADMEIAGLPVGLPLPSEIIPQTPAMYNADIVKHTAYTISRFLSENGYPYNRITASATQEDSVIFIVHFLIEPDERVCVGGPVFTRADNRSVGDRSRRMYGRDVRIISGQLYNSADVDETVQRLSRRSYIKSVYAASPVIVEGIPRCDIGSDFIKADAAPATAENGDAQIMSITRCKECVGNDSLRTVVVPHTVVENVGMVIEGALGYESGRGGNSGTLSGRIDFSLINMLRWGETAEASYMGTSILQRLRLSASRPWIFNLPLEMGVSLGLEVEDEGYGFFDGELRAVAESPSSRLKYGAAVRVSETVPPDTVEVPYKFYGADVFMALVQDPWERGRVSREFTARTGSGVANREDGAYNRSSMELTVGAHRPIFATDYAFAWRICAQSLFTGEERLLPAEKYRVGGHGSLRGYSEEEFAYRSVLYLQLEALYYFNRTGALFVFIDGGMGFDEPERLSLSAAIEMLGYGAGIRFPLRVGAVSLEWAKNKDDGWGGLGRVHMGIKRQM